MLFYVNILDVLGALVLFVIALVWAGVALIRRAWDSLPWT